MRHSIAINTTLTLDAAAGGVPDAVDAGGLCARQGGHQGGVIALIGAGLCVWGGEAGVTVTMYDTWLSVWLVGRSLCPGGGGGGERGGGGNSVVKPGGWTVKSADA
jgi:hypothetical protein